MRVGLIALNELCYRGLLYNGYLGGQEGFARLEKDLSLHQREMTFSFEAINACTTFRDLEEIHSTQRWGQKLEGNMIP